MLAWIPWPSHARASMTVSAPLQNRMMRPSHRWRATSDMRFLAGREKGKRVAAWAAESDEAAVCLSMAARSAPKRVQSLPAVGKLARSRRLSSPRLPHCLTCPS